MAGVSFSETMRGTLAGADGVPRPVEFDLVAEAESVRGLLSHGNVRARGIMRASPWAAEVECAGTMEVAPHRGRIAYDLQFSSEDGRAFRLEGSKSPTLLAPVSSMTTLPVRLHDGSGAVVAEGTVYFDMKDLLPFLLSWVPGGGSSRRLLDARRRTLARRALAGA